MDSVVWARQVDQPVRIFLDDKDYSEVTIIPKTSETISTFPAQSNLEKGNFVAKKGVKEQRKGGQDQSIEDVQT